VLSQRKFRGDAEAALQALRDKNDADIEVLQALAEGYSRIRQDMARHLVNKILAIDPENGAALALRGYLHMKEPDHPDLERARDDLVRALAHGKDSYYYSEARLLLAVCLRDQGSFAEALKLYRECAADRPQDWRAAYGVGMCERYLGNYQQAMGAFQRVLEIIPGYVNARLQIAYIHEVLGEMPQSLNVLRTIEAQYPDEPQMLMQTAKILTKMGDKAQAAEYQKRYEALVQRTEEKGRSKTKELEIIGPPGRPSIVP
jgi:tetratricopeptide (TPR) repeat protein